MKHCHPTDVFDFPPFGYSSWTTALTEDYRFTRSFVLVRLEVATRSTYLAGCNPMGEELDVVGAAILVDNLPGVGRAGHLLRANDRLSFFKRRCHSLHRDES